MSTAPLVGGRECGGCVECCIAPPIDDPELRKHAGAKCRNCTGAGCAIYETRPRSCRVFHCGWRALAELDDDWRPDRSGVLILLEPAAGSPRGVLTFMLLRDPRKIIQTPRFIQRARAEIGAGADVFLSLPGRPGYLPVRTRISNPQIIQVTDSNPALFGAFLEKALVFLETAPRRRYRFPDAPDNETHEAEDRRSGT